MGQWRVGFVVGAEERQKAKAKAKARVRVESRILVHKGLGGSQVLHPLCAIDHVPGGKGQRLGFDALVRVYAS